MEKFAENCVMALHSVGVVVSTTEGRLAKRLHSLYWSGAVDKEAAEVSYGLARAVVIAALRDIADELEGGNPFLQREVNNLRRF